MNILTEYPIWFFIFCLAAGLLFALALYYRERKSEFPPGLKRLMMVIRFLSVSIISFLLLSPLFKMQVQIKEKPKLLIFQDNSRSIIQGADSSFYLKDYLPALQELQKEVDHTYEPVFYTFTAEVSGEVDNPDFHGSRTDVSSVFDFIDDRYANRNVGAVILATDGIYNTGKNPLFAAGELPYPLHTLALGDTLTIPDVRINQLNYNEIAFLGNEFPVEVNLHADKSKGKEVRLEISKGGKRIASRKIEINSEDFNKNYRFLLKAGQTGLQEYNVEVGILESELNVLNNKSEFYIDVIDTRRKILVLYNAPHPDIAALRSVLEKNMQYETHVYALDEFTANIEQYNLLFFHQLPSGEISSLKLREQASEAGIPILYIIGSQTNIDFFNNMTAGMTLTNPADFEDAYPALSDEFNLFTLSESLKNTIDKWPPLQVYFANYLISNSAYVFLNQRIGNLVTEKPLMIFNAPTAEKSAVIAGEGLWRWRMTDFNMNKNQDNFDEIIGKTVRYLSLQADKEQFRVKTEKIYNEFEEVELNARLYNENYEMVNTPEVELVISGSDGEKYPFIMGRKDEGYYLNAGNFPVGVYNYKANVEWNADHFTDEGMFRVRNSNLENLKLSADHNLLYRIAQMHGGAMFYPQQMDELKNRLNESGAASIISYRQEYTELLNLPWLLALLIFLLAAEWFLRKLNGSY